MWMLRPDTLTWITNITCYIFKRMMCKVGYLTSSLAHTELRAKVAGIVISSLRFLLLVRSKSGPVMFRFPFCSGCHSVISIFQCEKVSKWSFSPKLHIFWLWELCVKMPKEKVKKKTPPVLTEYQRLIKAALEDVKGIEVRGWSVHVQKILL